MEGPRREEVELAVRRALGEPALTLVAYSVRPASAQAAGFMGTHLRVAALVCLRQGPQEEVCLFGKAPPDSRSHRDYVASCGLFRREGRMLVEYGPQLRAALGQRGGPPLPMPQCLAARGGGELILMEDLACRGFEMADKKRPMGLEECRAVLRALARLHGASVLLMRKERALREQMEAIEEAVLFHDDAHPASQWNRYSAETFATAVSLLWPERFGGVAGRQKVLDAAWGSWTQVFRGVRKSEKFLNVLCHGDAWANNIMFRHASRRRRQLQRHFGDDDQVEDPTEVFENLEVILVDYQLHRYAPPVLDILFFLHSATRRALRDKHLECLLKHYRAAFSHVVTPEVADVILPWEQLTQSARDLHVFGKCVSGTSLLPVVLAPGGQQEDFVEGILRDRGSSLVSQMEADQELRERLEEAFMEYLECVGLWE